MKTAEQDAGTMSTVLTKPAAGIQRDNYTCETPKQDSQLGISDALNRVGLQLNSSKKKETEFVEVNSYSYKPGNLTGLILMLFCSYGIAFNFELINSTTVLPLLVNTVNRVLCLFPAVYWVIFQNNSCQYFIRKLAQRLRWLKKI